MPSRGSPHKGDKIRSGYIIPALLGARNWVEWLHNLCLLGGSPINEDKNRSAHIILAFSGPRNWAEWLHNLCLLGNSTNNGDKIRSAYIIPPLSGARNWTQWLHNPCLFGSPTTMGTRSQMVPSSLVSRGPGIGRNGYITPVFSGVPQQWGQNEMRLHHPCFLGGPEWGGMAT